MFTRSTTALFLILLATRCYAGIDLTPYSTEYVANGMKFQQLVFKDDKRRIEYEPPRGWNFDGGANQLHLRPAQKNFAEALINVAPLGKPQAFDENSIKLLEQQLLEALPEGSQFAKVEEATVNSVLVGGNESVEITLSYQLMGEKFLKSALIVNLKDAQLVFRLTAKKADFPALHRDFKSSIFSWHWIEEKTAEAPQSTNGGSNNDVR